MTAALAAVQPTPLLADVHVPGIPRTKGSLRHIGHGRMVEQHGHSTDWRRAVAATVHEQIRCRCTTPGCRNVLAGYPVEGPVAVTIALLFPRPKSAPKTRPVLPSTRSTGDGDKHARNIFDALQDSGLIKDDAQVVDHAVSKRYCTAGQVPGARIVVTRVDPATAVA